MNAYAFTDRVRIVLQMAREEAARLNHEYVGTEHLLLGLLSEGRGLAVTVLTNLGVDLKDVRQKIEAIVKVGKNAPRDSSTLDTLTARRRGPTREAQRQVLWVLIVPPPAAVPPAPATRPSSGPSQRVTPNPVPYCSNGSP